ncbi:MAG: hypothetical protein LBQ83_06815 [Candidatus Margulisbacteria bacterium]|jgi:hypothetical protein|nr:hypothetical protein [Candidatus Margulisiibacteriota bacterium]
MVDISSIGKNLNLDSITTAGAAQSAGAAEAAEKKKLMRRRPLEGKGLGLEDIPEESPYVPVQDASVLEEEPAAGAVEDSPETEEVYSEEENTEMLAKIDYELATLQALLKKVLSKKIALAAQNEDARHKLLISAFEDCKNAYVKVREVREFLG